MKTILLLLSISPFFLGKANSWSDPSNVKYANINPPYPPSDDSTGLINVGQYEYRSSYTRHRRPDKQNRRIPEIPDGQAYKIPDRPSPWLPHKPNLPYPNREIVVIPKKPSSGSGPLISVPCVEKPKKCRRTGSRNWSRSVITATGSVPNNGSCECGISDASKMIIQGRRVDPPFKYPWMVAIQRRDGLIFCGGAILNNQYILTAAHCLVKGYSGFFRPSEIQVAFVTNSSQVSKGEDITHIIPYPTYEYWKKDHDIALLKLKVRIQCSYYRRPICLPAHRMPEKEHFGQEFIIAGWGTLEAYTYENSPFLMETTIKLVGSWRCHSIFKCPMLHFHCLQGVNNTSPCYGDSGGPMFFEHQNRFYVYGVGSLANSHNCTTSDVFAYTQVTDYLDWIRNKMRR